MRSLPSELEHSRVSPARIDAPADKSSWPAHIGILVLLGLAAVFSTRGIWQTGVASTGDMLMGVYRVFELREAVASGVVYPRLGANLNFGYGAPLFQFYPPLASYGALILHYLGLDLIDASKGMFVLSIFAGAVGVYCFAYTLYSHRAASAVSAAAYLFSPYLLLVALERGAAAESLALAITPWVFWSFLRVLRQPGWRVALYAGAALALVVLAHNITALFVLPAVLIFSVLVAVGNGLQHRLPALGLSVVTGLSLSAFYWLPAIGEVKYTLTEEQMLFDAAQVASNLASWQELFQTNLVFDYWGEARFRFAWWQALLGLIALICLPFQRGHLRIALGSVAVIGLLALLLQVEISRLFWEVVPLVKYVQFAWRLLGLASFSTAVLIGGLVMLPVWRGASVWWFGMLLIAGLALPASYNLQRSTSPLWYEIKADEIGLVDLFARGHTGFSLFSDYTPRDLQTLLWEFSRSQTTGAVAPEALPQAPNIVITRVVYDRMYLAVRSAIPFRLRAHRLFFPGWRVYQDGQPLDTLADGDFGLVAADMPAGEYEASIRFDQTPLRRVADLLSRAAILLWVGGLFWVSAPGKRWRGVLVVLLVVCALLLPVGLRRQASFTPTAYAVNFQDELHLLGYRLPQGQWHAGERVALRLFWLAQDMLGDYKVFLHLVTLDDSSLVAQFDSEPQLSYSHMSTWNPGEIVDDLYYLDLDDAIPPGKYLLLIGVYQLDPLQNLEVRNAPETLPGERVVLGQVDVVVGE